MNIKDCAILQKCADEAIVHRDKVAVTLAEEYFNTGSVTKETQNAYHEARLGVESTQRDLEYCMGLELASIED